MSVLARSIQDWVRQTGMSGFAVFFGEDAKVTSGEADFEIEAKFKDEAAVDALLSEHELAANCLTEATKDIRARVTSFHASITKTSRTSGGTVDCIWLAKQRYEISLLQQTACHAMSQLAVSTHEICESVELTHRCREIEPYWGPSIPNDDYAEEGPKVVRKKSKQDDETE